MPEAAPPGPVSQVLVPLSAPAAWRAALQGLPHAFGHTWENCYAMHLTTGHPTFLYVLESGGLRVVCPLAERDYQGATDVVTPYGFSGLVGTQDFPDFAAHWQQFMARAGYVCGYIGLNPHLADTTYFPAADTYQHNQVYLLDLQLSREALFQNLPQSRKSQLKGLAAREQHFTTDREELTAFFIAHYHSFLARKNAAAVYLFSRPTLAYLLALEEVQLVGFREAGAVKAVSVFAATPYLGEYLFNVSLPGYQNQTTPLLWLGAMRLKEKGVPCLNLGGGMSPDDSLARFKQRFGAVARPLTCLKQVYNEPAYDALCRGAQKDPADKAGYFPAYRREKTGA